MSFGMRLVQWLGMLIVVVGTVLFVMVAFGVLDTWLDEHWTCATGGGISHKRACGWYEAKWSALVLSGALTLIGFLVALVPEMRGRGQ